MNTPRIILFTGKGGVGKTTTAAGTALYGATQRRKTLVLSTDAAHSLADAYDQPIGAEPTEVAPYLWVQHVDTQRRFEQSWGEIQRYLLSVLGAAGVDPITAEELTVLPGADEVLALLALRSQVVSENWDLVVVDCGPTAETLRLLALPEALNWYMHRMFGVQRTMVKALRPVLTKAAGVPMPDDGVFAALERLHGDLDHVSRILRGKTASIRLVLTPETMVVAEARRTLTTLSLYGYRVDGVIANRVFPEDAGDAWRQGWVNAQQEVLAQVRESFGELPIWSATYRPAEPVGHAALLELTQTMYGPADPFATAPSESSVSISRLGDVTILSLALPFVAKDMVDLARHGEELVITVGAYRRILALPAILKRATITGARIIDGALQVRFAIAPERTAYDRAQPAATGR